MDKIFEQTYDIWTLFTIVRQTNDPRNDVIQCNDCKATVSIGRDTKKLNAHVVGHYIQLKTLLRGATTRNISQESVSSESAVNRTNCSSNMEGGSQISRSRQSGAENTQSESGEAEKRRMQSLLAEIMTKIPNIREEVNGLSDIIHSIESELNPENSRNE